MDRLASMAVFVRVAEAKSFAAAAAELDISATMVANHVRSLEQHLGARLIERTTRRHALTDIGSAYLEHCREILASVEAADGVAEAVRTQPAGVLRVTAPVTYGAYHLVPALAEYCRRYPEVRVELDLNDRVVDLEEEGFHIGIRSGHVANERLVALPLKPSPMVAAASPGYLEQHGVPRHPADLRAHNCLAFTAWGANPSWRFTQGEEAVIVPLRGSFTVNNGQALMRAAVSGMGVIVQAGILLDAAFHRGELLQLLPDWALPARAMRLVYPRRVPPSAKRRTLVEFLSGSLG